MKRKGIFLFLLLISLPQLAVAADADDIIGVWYTENNESKIKIYKCGLKYCGKIIWLKEPNFKSGDEEAGKPKRDRKNPNVSLQSRPILGLNLLWGFVYENGSWEKGRIYDPKKGSTYKCKIRLEGNNLHVRGYIGFSFIGRTTTWTRAN